MTANPPGARNAFASASSPWAAATSGVFLVVLMLGTMAISPQGPWMVFLCGMLAASAIACVSHIANARWVLARRTRQLVATRRNLAEERRRLAQAEARFQTVAPHAEMIDRMLPAMVAYIDVDGVVRYHNEAYGRWAGLHGEAIDGHKVAEVLGAENFAAVEERLRQALEGREVRYERTQRAGGGKGTRLFAHYVPHLIDGKVAGAFAILTDITTPEDVEACRGADRARARADVAERVTAALDGGEFHLYAQPVAALDPASAGCALREVSVRLREEEDNHTPPGAFLALAEDAGLMPQLDRWVVGQVLDAAAAPGALRSVYLVNVAPATVAEGAFAAFVAGELAARGLGGDVLCLEFAEPDVMANPRAYRDLIRALSGLGCQFMVSGFGRNPLALPFLKQLRLNFLKLDGGIVLAMQRDPAQRARLEAINAAAHGAGMRTVADCVENDGTRTLLRHIHTDFALGLGIAGARPLASPILERAAA